MEARTTNTQSTNLIRWEWYKFKDLTAVNCYKLLQLRAKIFIEEQGYAYNDMDNLDYNALHLLGFVESKTKKNKNKDGSLIAYARLIFPEPNTVEVGRVTVHENYRKLGIGTALMNQVIDTIDKLYPSYHATLKIGVDQYSQHLPKFYSKFGFELPENRQPATHTNYEYKNFDFPTLEMTRVPQFKIVQNKDSKMSNHCLSFFKQHRLKETNRSITSNIQPRPI